MLSKMWRTGIGIGIRKEGGKERSLSLCKSCCFKVSGINILTRSVTRWHKTEMRNKVLNFDLFQEMLKTIVEKDFANTCVVIIQRRPEGNPDEQESSFFAWRWKNYNKEKSRWGIVSRK